MANDYPVYKYVTYIHNCIDRFHLATVMANSPLLCAAGLFFFSIATFHRKTIGIIWPRVNLYFVVNR